CSFGTSPEPAQPRVEVAGDLLNKTSPFSPDNRWLVTQSNAKDERSLLKFWDLSAKTGLKQPAFTTTNVGFSLTFSPNSRWLASVSKQFIELWDLRQAPWWSEPFLLPISHVDDWGQSDL